MHSFQIKRGMWKGRRLRYPAPLQGHHSFTPSIVKEAFFELLLGRMARQGQEVSDYAFFDLCAGSAQMGIEALSIGFKDVHICEVAMPRIKHVQKQLEALAPDTIHYHRRDFRRMVKVIQGFSCSILYIDMPYSFWSEKPKSTPPLRHFISQIYDLTNNLEESIKVFIFIQGPRYFQLENIIVGSAETAEYRRYGRQHLSFWHWGGDIETY